MLWMTKIQLYNPLKNEIGILIPAKKNYLIGQKNSKKLIKKQMF